MIEVYTDGSCIPNPGPGGWAYVIKNGKYTRTGSGGSNDTTSNRMEMTAVIRALSTIKSKQKVVVYSDSKYVINGAKIWVHAWVKRNWITSKGTEVKNADLWRKIYAIVTSRDVKFVHVKGHNGDEYNELCHEMALSEARKRNESNSRRLT